MKQHKLKVRLLSLLTALTMLASALGAMPLATSAAEVSASSIKIGDYVQMGGITWRCVGFELATNQSNGSPVIDSTKTGTSYMVSNTGNQYYLPLMLADTSVVGGSKEFDAVGSNTNGSHGRNNNRTGNGSNYWGDSNIRNWLNSSASAGNVTWSCGNAPSYSSKAGFLTNFNDTEKAAMQTVTQKSLLANADRSLAASGSAVHTYNYSISDVVQNYTDAYSEQITDTMFLLDVQQLYNVYTNLGNYYKLFSYYWLRSPDSSDSYNVRYVSSNGYVSSASAYYGYSYVVRPAFFLNPSAKFVCGDGTVTKPYLISHSIAEGKDENGRYTYCSNCGQELSRAAHTYTADDSKHTCSECGYSAKHTYDENHVCTACNHECSHSLETPYQTLTTHYKVCYYCGRKTEPAAHTYNAENANETWHTCEECGYSQSHSFGAYEIEKQPTSTEDGVKKRTCSICGYMERTTFTKTAHSKNSTHNLCNNSDCTIAGHKLPTSEDWIGTYSDTTLIYAFPIGSDSPSSYYLYNIIKSGTTLTGEWTIPAYVTKKKLYNCLDGERLTLSNGAYIHIQSGQTYSLTDCRGGIGDIYGGTDGVIKIDAGGTFDFYEGTITGNSGEGIIVNNGTMNLYGGTITNNAGAAIINNGTLNIYGGTITNNTGGGIIGTGTINFKKVDCSTGNPVIANNTIDGEICNVKSTGTISVTELGEEASIGFTPATAVTAGSPAQISANGGEYYSHFVSDSDDYAIIKSDNKIQIVAAHSVLEHHEAKAATCTEGGNEEYWSCADCDRLYSDKDGNTEIYAVPTIEASGHSIVHHEEVSPTCTESGTGEYWECTACHKLYSDENGTTEISAIPTIPSIGQHTWGEWQITTPATETTKGEETRECSVCHEVQTRDIPVLGHTHTMTAHEAKAATGTEDGNIAYWECTSCGKLFSDAEGTTEITMEDIIIPATGTEDTDKFSIRYENGNAIVTAPEAGKYTVIFAAYDANGVLTSVDIRQDEPVGIGETTVTPRNFTANDTVKVMLWKDFNSMEPLC